MQNIIYATYRSPGEADQAFVELLQRGASILDLAIITQHTYQDNAGTDDGRLDISEPLFERGVGMIAPPEPGHVAEPRDPFLDPPAGIRMLDNLHYPGDLAGCLSLLGFAEPAALDIETMVLRGGAFLILRIPSGPVNDMQAWEAVERYGGTVMAPAQSHPYLG